MDSKGNFKIDNQTVKAMEHLDGKYLIRSSDDTLSVEDIALGYKQLLEVERAFRTLKTTLELRPVYHRCQDFNPDLSICRILKGSDPDGEAYAELRANCNCYS